jgi:hypothetical protein
MAKNKKVFTDVEGVLTKNAVDMHTTHANVRFGNDSVLDAKAVKTRIEKCLAKNVCFISLRTLDEVEAVEVNHSAGVVKIHPKYA